VLRNTRASAARDLVGEVVKAVSTFSGPFRTDDITVVAIRGI